MGKTAFALFIIFTLFMIVLVTASFLSLTATSLTSWWPLDELGLPAGQTLLRERISNGVPEGCIGGIASTSAIVLTIIAPFMGFLIYRRSLNTIAIALLAVIVCVMSVFIGLKLPISISPGVWMVVLSIYCILAAGVPVWLVLQPRDYVNSFILFLGILALIAGVSVGGFSHVGIRYPIFNIQEGTAKMGFLWPTLFITVACGAISGFHSLVAGGTTSKQCPSETYARRISYGGMLVEGLLAVVVLLTVASCLPKTAYVNAAFAKGSGNPGLAFSLGMGNLLHMAFGLPVYMGTVFGILMVEGFMVTTLDTAVRLNRYLFEELWSILFQDVPRILKTYWFNALLSVGLMYGLAKFQGWQLIWPVFGTANQLLAALTLITVTVWLVSRGTKVAWITLAPALVMIVTTSFNLVYLLFRPNGFLVKQNWILVIVDVALLALSAGMVIVAAKSLLAYRTGSMRVTPDSRLFLPVGGWASPLSTQTSVDK